MMAFGLFIPYASSRECSCCKSNVPEHALALHLSLHPSCETCGETFISEMSLVIHRETRKCWSKSIISSVDDSGCIHDHRIKKKSNQSIGSSSSSRDFKRKKAWKTEVGKRIPSPTSSDSENDYPDSMASERSSFCRPTPVETEPSSFSGEVDLRSRDDALPPRLDDRVDSSIIDDDVGAISGSSLRAKSDDNAGRAHSELPGKLGSRTRMNHLIAEDDPVIINTTNDINQVQNQNLHQVQKIEEKPELATDGPLDLDFSVGIAIEDFESYLEGLNDAGHSEDDDDGLK